LILDGFDDFKTGGFGDYPSSVLLIEVVNVFWDSSGEEGDRGGRENTFSSSRSRWVVG
jgi:hypothetical protein